MTEPTTSTPTPIPAARLVREVGLAGAIALGLGSMLGSGVFLSLGVAAGVAGAGIVIAVTFAALVALFNGLSSAQLAASHPVSGGTYEYGYRYLTPSLGFTAGWMFLLAKSASAATAALGVTGYALRALDLDVSPVLRAGIAIAIVLALTATVAGGIRRSNRTNAVIVTLTLLGLAAFVAAGVASAITTDRAAAPLDEFPAPDALLHATALLFVAYTGYGRIATLGEEVREPARTIPIAIVTTVFATMAIYGAVAIVAVFGDGGTTLAAAARTTAAPLEAVADTFGIPAVRWVVVGAAITAMTGVVLNLVLGLSRVMLAMGRRRDLPHRLAHIDDRGSPTPAVWTTGILVAAIAAIGDVGTTWSFSAFTVLVYYALTNAAALRLPPADRRFPRAFAWLGLACCTGLAFWVDPAIWLAGLACIAVGLVWHRIASAGR